MCLSYCRTTSLLPSNGSSTEAGEAGSYAEQQGSFQSDGYVPGWMAGCSTEAAAAEASRGAAAAAEVGGLQTGKRGREGGPSVRW